MKRFTAGEVFFRGRIATPQDRILKIGAATYPLTAGADSTPIPIWTTGDFTVREVYGSESLHPPRS